MVLRICVVGAGVVGLSTALRLLQQWPSGGRHVTIMADAFNAESTSDGAFGFWEVYLVGDTPKDKVRKWSVETLEHMKELAKSPEAKNSGTFMLSGHSLHKETFEIPSWASSLLHFHRMSEKELEYYPGYKCGWSYTSFATECRTYLPWLMNRFVSNGGRVVRRRITSFQELYADYDVIVNCCGLRARELVQDPELFPIKGQVLRVEAPWLKHWVMDDAADLYILPGANNVLLGGTHEVGVWDKRLCLEQRKRIFEGCCKLEPSLKEAKILFDWVGLRPGRSSVRVEKEDIQYAGRTIRLVYNYGHGGSGVTLHWGCAGEAANLAVDGLTGTLNSKL